MKRASIIVLLILIVDQIVKIWVKTHMEIGDSIPVLGNWFYLHFVENEGMAYGMKFGGDYGKLFLSVFRLIAIVGIGYYLFSIIRKKYHTMLIVSISFIFAGAIGNMIDSAFYGLIFSKSGPFTLAQFMPPEGGYETFLHGRVVDMFYFPITEGIWPHWVPFIGGNHFAFFEPVFNIADASISVGVAILIIFQKKFYVSKTLNVVDETDEIEDEY